MHVCHMCDSSLEGDYFRNIARELTPKCVRISLIELGTGSPPTWLADLPGVTYWSMGAAGKLQYLLAARRLANYLAENSVDILHAHLFYSGLIAVLSKRLRKETVVAVMRHHTGVVRMLGTLLHVRADRWMAENADRVLTVSNAARAYMIETDGIRRDDIEVVHLGFDFEKLAPNRENRDAVRREFGFADNEVVVGYVANFAPGKGHAELLEAFAQLRARHANVRLLLAGRGRLDAVDELAAELPAGSVKFAGWRTDIPAVLNALDIFVQPSLSEAFSQVIMEALGVGLPVIATDVGGAGEVIDTGRNGILVPPGDPRAIAAAIDPLIADRAERQRLGAEGRASVVDRFSADKMAARHLELYERWLAER